MTASNQAQWVEEESKNIIDWLKTLSEDECAEKISEYRIWIKGGSFCSTKNLKSILENMENYFDKKHPDYVPF